MSYVHNMPVNLQIGPARLREHPADVHLRGDAHYRHPYMVLLGSFDRVQHIAGVACRQRRKYNQHLRGWQALAKADAKTDKQVRCCFLLPACQFKT